jgi:transposase
MSLKAQPVPPVPPETVRGARAAFPKGTLDRKRREELGTLVQDVDFVALFAKEGPPALPPWRLALVTLLQFRENLSDRQAAEAVRARIDWKYLRSLELTAAGCDCSGLSDFRARLIAGEPRNCCSRNCSAGARPRDWSKREGNNAPIPRMSWRPSAP